MSNVNYLPAVAISLVLWSCSDTGRRDQAARPDSREQSPPHPAKLVPVQQAFELLRGLSEQNKLLPSSVTGGGHVNFFVSPRSENCFGVILPSGARLIGESAGEPYNVALSSGAPIGFLHAEADFQIEGKDFAKGTYMLGASTDQLIVWGDSRETRQRFGKEVPYLRTERFPLTAVIAESLVGRESAARPRFGLIVDRGKMFIQLEGNRLAIVVK